MNDSTNNQATALDHRQWENKGSCQGEAEEGNQPVKFIRLQFGVGSAWSDLRVDILSIQQALGLPNYPLFRNGEDIYRPMQLPELPEEDNIDDDKHANQQN